MRKKLGNVLKIALIGTFCIHLMLFASGTAFASPGEDGAEARYQAEENGEWLYGTLAEALSRVCEGGTVELMQDFYITGQTGIPGITKPMTLRSADPDNPCKLTCAINGHPTLLMVLSDARLEHIIIDGGAENGLLATGPLVLVQKGNLTLGEGASIQNNQNVNNSKGTNWLGGGVFLYGTMTMEPGSSVKNCFAWAGGGVAVVNGSFLTMTGGCIENCGSYQGGGVSIFYGSFELQDGEVKNCQALTPPANLPLDKITDINSPGEGGGVFLAWGNCSMAMSGGCISGNSARFGGGIGCDAGTLTVSGGTVTGNSADVYGGGILASPYLKISLWDDFLIADNFSGVEGYENLYLDGSEDVEDGTETRPFTVTAPVTANIDLGLARWVKPDAEHPCRVVAVPGMGYEITEEDLAHFVSDADGYVLQLKDGNIVLTTAKVNFDNQGHGMRPDDQSLNPDRTVPEPETLTETGYTFDGWYLEAACVNQWKFASYHINCYHANPVTLYAKWTPTPYDIIYNLDGGTNDSANPEVYTIESKTITLHAPSREGYDFLGWTWDGVSEPQLNATIPKGTTGERAFTAQWEPTPYDIIYKLDGGTNDSTNPDSYTIESETITLHAPSREGYDFLGWTWDGVSEPQPNATIPKGTTGERAFTAQWEPTPYDIIYKLDGGTNDSTNPDSYTIESETITLHAPLREGYDFLGWTWDGVSEPQPNATIPKGTTGERTFTAHWEKKAPPKPPDPPVVYYTITASAGEGGSVDPKGYVTVIYGGTKRFTAVPDEGFEVADVLVDGVSVGPVSEYVFDRVARSHTIEFRFAKARCPRDETCPIWPYTDASTTEWYHDGVHYCIENGLMVGYGNDIFAPYDALTRGMLAQILYNRQNRPEVTGECPFTDVEADTWYAAAITFDNLNGFVFGYGDGRFGPEDPVTREQLAAILWRYAGCPESASSLDAFPDGAETSLWAVDAMRWAVEQGIVEARDGILAPAGTSTRAEAAGIVMRFCEMADKT